MKKKKPGPPKGRKQADIRRTSIGERIYNTRKARGYTQAELGKRIGLSNRMIAHYEGYNVLPPIDVLKQIADALDVTVSYLLGESTQKKIVDNLKPSLRRHIEILRELPPSKQKTILEMVESFAYKTK
jgi:transcriptional regulator with XRE-family HTH domain